ncbi:MAG: response regulator transcription factor [Eubacteriales bacterium]|nr:response regulator transcription factor [Eubacteriales bacterium]
MKDILLVEDNEEIGSLTKLFLEKSGYTVEHVCSGEAALDYLGAESVKLMILDIMLPGIDGFAVCRAARRKCSMPVIILSARCDKSDKLNGYGLGADDYMEKPFDMDLLLAKTEALLNRSYSLNTDSGILVSGGITVDRNARRVWLEREEVKLNAKEFDLLMLFVENPGTVLNKEYIFNSIWGCFSESENQTLTVHIRMLREKVEKDQKHPQRIQTVWGVGYRYEEI